MSEKAVPDPWEAVVMPTECAGVASTSLGMVVPAPVWSPAVVMVAECVPIDGNVGVLGDEFADFGGDSVNQRDHERDDRREESGEGSKHLSISFVLHSLAEGVRHVETETGAFFLGDREDVGEFVQARFHGERIRSCCSAD